MDLESLAAVLNGALSNGLEERNAAEQRLNQLQYTQQHLLRLLQIIVDGVTWDMTVRQAASIHFKNFIAKNWLPSDPETQGILETDKAMVREHILGFIVQVPPLLRAQLGESIKTIVHSDYPEQWPNLLNWIKTSLETQDQQIFGALYVLRILTRKYEFKSDEERVPLHMVVEETFPRLLNIFNNLVQLPNPSVEAADLMKLICKIFWSSIYV